MNAPFEIQLYVERIALLGDREAFEKLFYYYYKRLKRFAMAIVKNSETAEEIASDVFVILWKNSPRLLEIENLNNYLYIAVRNLSLRQISKSQKVDTFSIDDLDFDLIPAYENNPEESLLNNEMIRHIEAAIEGLPSRCKTIYKLVKQDGLKYKEIAAILNLSVRTIDAQMAIATRKISQSIRFYLPESASR